MDVFVTGAAGFVGGAVVERLLADGDAVRGLVLPDDSDPHVGRAGYTSVPGSLEDLPLLAAESARAGGVVHTGWSPTGGGAVDVAAVRAMVDALAGSSRPFVYTSGVFVVSDTGEEVVDETAAPRPAALIAERVPVEEQLGRAAARDVRTVVVRPGLVFGRGGGNTRLWTGAVDADGVAPVWGDGSALWSLVHVDDLADLYTRALRHAPAGSVYFGVAGAPVRAVEFARAVSLAAGGRGEVTHVDPEVVKGGGLPAALVDAFTVSFAASGERAERELGWAPRHRSVVDFLHATAPAGERA